MALVDLITKEVVKIPLESTTKPGVIQELLDVLVRAGKLENAREAYEALMDRESRGSTGLENGIAVPHGKVATVRKLTLAVGIAPQGIDFDALDGKLSKIFFLMLASPDYTGPHIEALSEIARITRSQAFCRALLGATSAEEVVDLFREH